MDSNREQSALLIVVVGLAVSFCDAVSGLAATALLAAESTASTAEEKCKITVYQLWGSDTPDKKKPPKALRKLIHKLKEKTKKKSFRLAAKPLVREVTDGGKVAVQLPQKYSAEWRLDLKGGKPRAQQTLTNPKKKKSVVRLTKSPAIATLAKIKDGEDDFILVVEFNKVRPGKKSND